MKYKLKPNVEPNGEEVRNVGDFEPISTEWLFSTLRDRRYEPDGRPITRITGQLGGLNNIIWKELWSGRRTPECVWDWLGRERAELGSSGSELANREIPDYFRGVGIVKNRIVNNVIVHHCLSVDFVRMADCEEAEVPQGEFSLFVEQN